MPRREPIPEPDAEDALPPDWGTAASGGTPSDWLTTDEAAAISMVKADTVRKWARVGCTAGGCHLRLRATAKGDRTMIQRRDLESFLRAYAAARGLTAIIDYPSAETERQRIKWEDEEAKRLLG